MSAEVSFRNAQRAITFARHMPIAKLLRRVELDVRRRLRDRLPASPARDVPPLTRVASPPLPLFPPRIALAPLLDGAGMRFCFLNRAVSMPGPHVDWSAPGPGPAHQLWRMNLHYMEYLEGVDDAEWGNLARDWIDANPPQQAGAWRDSWNGYALSLRVVVWLQELARRAERLAEDAVQRVEASAVAQVRFIARNLETDLGGNHLIKNIKALLWASAFFAGPEAARWRRKGLQLLSAELGRQILPDGMHSERSASYHAQVFADLLECRHALGEDPLGGRLDGVLHRMAQVTADLAHPDGGPVLFNDAGLTMAYAPADCLAGYRRLYGWQPDPRRLFALDAAGTYGLRSRDSYLVADCGRIAPDDLPAHGHGDVLSFEWSVGGERIIVDPGVYEYVAGERRRRARSAASHNTLCFEGADQADFFGAFRCGRRPNVDVQVYARQDDRFVLEGSHDGFRNLPGRPRHVRRFEVSPDAVIIADRIEGSPRRTARIGFLLHPAVEVAVAGREATLRRGAAPVRMTATQPIEVEPAVWWPDMGHEIATRRLVLRLAPGVMGATTELRVDRRTAGATARS